MADRATRSTRSTWSSPDVVAARLRPRWGSGALLAAYARGEAFEPVRVRLRGPSARELGEDLEAVRSWSRAWEREAPGRFEIERRSLGARTVGASELPVAVVVTDWEQAWRTLAVEGDVQAWRSRVELVRADAEVLTWVLDHPHAALAVPEEEWTLVLSALGWLRAERGSGRRLREITAPGVDTKFVERHRGLLAGLLGVSASTDGFLAGLGLVGPPARLRVRLGAEVGDGPLRDVAAPVEEWAALDLDVASAVIVENETTFLTIPVPRRGVAIFGEGFRVSRAGRLPWLAEVPVHYWGDLDTHGFAILDQLRAWLPQTRSFLMDEQTLLQHRERWVAEPSPTTADLTRLTAAERGVYEDLVTDRYGDRVRLEQERVDWAWASDRWPVEA